MKGKFIILTMIALLLCVFAEGQEISVVADYPEVVQAGQQFSISWTINSGGGEFSEPSFTGFYKLMGPQTSYSSSTQIINGKISRETSYTYIYYLQALKEGRYVIPPAEITIKNKTEFLLANNERYSETQLYSIRKFPFPLKIKVNRPSNTFYDVFDIKELIDQVYSFSRLYWKSINQVSLPVTIAYSKIVADLAAHFIGHRLPEKEIAHSNLWFL